MSTLAQESMPGASEVTITQGQVNEWRRIGEPCNDGLTDEITRREESAAIDHLTKFLQGLKIEPKYIDTVIKDSASVACWTEDLQRRRREGDPTVESEETDIKVLRPNWLPLATSLLISHSGQDQMPMHHCREYQALLTIGKMDHRRQMLATGKSIDASKYHRGRAFTGIGEIQVNTLAAHLAFQDAATALGMKPHPKTIAQLDSPTYVPPLATNGQEGFYNPGHPSCPSDDSQGW